MGIQKAPVLVMDSGLGGLSVLVHLRAQMPGVDFLYLADHAFFPYGLKSSDSLRERFASLFTTPTLAACEDVILACHTAGCALGERHFPADFSFMRSGMRGAKALRVYGMLKPLVEHMQPLAQKKAFAGRRLKVVLMGTDGLVRSRFYEEAFSQVLGVQLFQFPCSDLVFLAESGMAQGEAVAGVLEAHAARIRELVGDLEEGESVAIVLCCTHFSFLLPIMESVMRQKLPFNPFFVDPAQLFVAQLKDLPVFARLNALQGQRAGSLKVLSTGQRGEFLQKLEAIIASVPPLQTLLTSEPEHLILEQALL